MSDRLVTLAIRTYERAQMIKVVMEEHGIETSIHNLNLEHPEMAVGVRVRIKEADLPRALIVVEEIEKEWEKDADKNEKIEGTILIPIDFSDPVAKSIDVGFHLAQNNKARVQLLYVYYSPLFTISSNNELSTYSISDSELLRRILSSANADVENMTNLIKKRISRGELPDVPFSFELKEGVPEDEILDYCKKNNPLLVVMGTRGKKESETSGLVGSVTAEVIDSCLTPVFALPLDTDFSNPEHVTKIAFLTNFEQKDLIAIDSVISTFKYEKLEIHLIHIGEKKEDWSEVLLSGIKNYFTNHYPKISTKYEMIIGSQDKHELLNNYLKDNKINVLAFNTRRRHLFARLLRPGLAYRMVLHSNTPLFVTKV